MVSLTKTCIHINIIIFSNTYIHIYIIFLEFIPGEPEWYKKGVEFKNEECQYGFGPLDANEKNWKKQRADAEPCLKKYVFGYGYTNKAITALFVIGAILRIGNQIMSFYWGCTEDDEAAKKFENNCF